MKRWQLYSVFLLLYAVVLLVGAATFELQSSKVQSLFFSQLGEQISYEVLPRPSHRIRYPATGPYDVRMGYTRLPAISRNLLKKDFKIEAQAEISPRMQQLIDLGVFPPYVEKTTAGLRIDDKDGQKIFQLTRPERTFASFDEIPSLIVNTLLFIENREILDQTHATRNPAVEWDRLGKAVFEKALQKFYPEHSAPGGSTLATQLEKYRHAFEGRTITAQDKLQQMLSASIRAYLNGPDTMKRRREIVLDYINSIPLAALPGYGEVNGLGDGLWAWYGVEMGTLVETLKQDPALLTPEELNKMALAYKQVLSLFIAHRRPSQFLLTDVSVLNFLVDEHLQLLSSQGVIPEVIRAAALTQDLRLRSSAPPSEPVSFLHRKAANAIRTKLLDYLGFENLYDLDQADLHVRSTLDKDVQEEVTEFLHSLNDPAFAKQQGLSSEHTLAKGDPSKVIFSVTLYEHRDGQNLLRVQTDNFDKPFSINEGTRLDLGSTAKLRTLTSYLEIVSKLHQQHAARSDAELKSHLENATDPISKWAIGYLLSAKDKTLATMCEAAMERRYSASTGEAFFTGGGLHTFVNFKKEDNGKNPTLWEAMRFSINLPFIRLMRDVVRYYMAQIPGSPTRVNDKMNEEARKAYLAKFADKEGSYFLERFYQKYRDAEANEVLPIFLREIKKYPVRLATIFRYVRPEASLEELGAFLKAELADSDISQVTLEQLYENYGTDKFPLNDQGFIAKVHPLELWLVRYLHQHPKAKLGQVLRASANERQEVYGWLFKTRYRQAQDSRIRTLIEVEAFLEIHESWKRLGYPFETLVPSYATAIGSSGDRPASLAELVGIILNDGIRYPSVRMDKLRFAKGTPFETVFTQKSSAGERLLAPEVAATLRKALLDVVANGTARRVSKAYLDADGKVIPIGGKTGTGDHRYETFGRGGGLLSSRVVSRTATFVFFIGTRFFGAVTAHVQGEQAAGYDFTSALAAEVLKILAPELRPLILENPWQNTLVRELVEGPGALACVAGYSSFSLAEQFIREMTQKTDRPVAFSSISNDH